MHQRNKRQIPKNNRRKERHQGIKELHLLPLNSNLYSGSKYYKLITVSSPSIIAFSPSVVKICTEQNTVQTAERNYSMHRRIKGTENYYMISHQRNNSKVLEELEGLVNMLLRLKLVVVNKADHSVPVENIGLSSWESPKEVCRHSPLFSHIVPLIG